MVFHLDYLKLTVFAPVAQVMRLTEQGLYDASNSEYGAWENMGQAKRWQAIHVNIGPVTILVPRHEAAGYCQVELKGQACGWYSSEELQGFLRYLSDSGVRWHGSRVDLAFDYVGFTPHDVWAAINERNFNSRCLKWEDRDWRENHLGATAYLGGRRTKKDRKLRVYDMRGFNRCEAEFTGTWARTAARHLLNAPVEDWPTEAIGLMRGMVDFIGRSANEKIERCPTLDWWQVFVGSAEKIRQLDDEDRARQEREAMEHVVAEAERRIARVARQLLPISQALGAAYLHQRLFAHGWQRLKAEDDAFENELRRIGKAGAIQWIDEQEGLDFVPI